MSNRNAQQLTQEYKLIPAIKKDLALTNLENMHEHEVKIGKYSLKVARLTGNFPLQDSRNAS